MQRGGLAVVAGEPASRDDVTATVIQRGHGVDQTIGLQLRLLGIGQQLARLGRGVAQVGDGREVIVFVVTAAVERHILPAETGFHLDHFFRLDAKLRGDH